LRRYERDGVPSVPVPAAGVQVHVLDEDGELYETERHPVNAALPDIAAC